MRAFQKGFGLEILEAILIGCHIDCCLMVHSRKTRNLGLDSHTVCQCGRSWGSCRQAHPVRRTYKIVLKISRLGCTRGRPRGREGKQRVQHFPLLIGQIRWIDFTWGRFAHLRLATPLVPLRCFLPG